MRFLWPLRLRSRLVNLSLRWKLCEALIPWALIPMMSFCALPAAAQTLSSAPAGGADPASNAPLTITLQNALQRAKANAPQFQAALTNYQLARQDAIQARAALLPSVTYNNQYLYTEGNGTASGRFIANNGVHEYLAQGNAHQIFGIAEIAEYRRRLASQAVARAKAEIATRGLVVTVVKNYYALVIAQRKYATAEQAAEEARQFLSISQELERGGEVAHSDSIKAQLQYQDRQRDLRESELEMTRSRLELAILMFPDFNQDFSVVDDLNLPPPLSSMQEIEAQAKRGNPDLNAALAAMREAGQEVISARAGYLPSLTFDYFYGIDATHFAVRDPLPPRSDGARNLGYAATAALSFPIWNWGATQSKLKQAELRRKQARLELTFAQRKLIADLRELYDEAEAARSELSLLSSSAELATESLHLTTLRYKAGEATVLEVVDAQNAFTLAHNNYDDGAARYRLALANLQTLTGIY
jgi:outer membrane protein TolC